MARNINTPHLLSIDTQPNDHLSDEQAVLLPKISEVIGVCPDRLGHQGVRECATSRSGANRRGPKLHVHVHCEQGEGEEKDNHFSTRKFGMAAVLLRNFWNVGKSNTHGASHGLGTRVWDRVTDIRTIAEDDQVGLAGSLPKRIASLPLPRHSTPRRPERPVRSQQDTANLSLSPNSLSLTSPFDV